MQAVARPDGRDMSVSDIPFNWNAQLDIRKLRVGYIKESFDDLPAGVVKDNADKLLETLRSLGVTKFIPMTIPVSQTNVSGLGVESAVFFDEMTRTGKMAGSRRGTRPTARLVPAVEYLQSQRLRMMMMTELAAATADVDVYVVASNAGGGGGGRGRGADPADPSEPTAAAAAGAAGAGAAGAAGAAGGRGERGGGERGGGRGRGTGEPARPPGPAQRHSTMANLACYPAINVPNGFTAAGTPTNVTFFARPFGEMELLALAKAYQDAAGHHLKKPTKMDG
jgi:Asp-tRNA(Asn)/Glu-tRNA(Gln) amidotransferase A subunit family amidase